MSLHLNRDHGGGLDAAIARFGGNSADWLDLSTGINPVPFPILPLSDFMRLEVAARRFWNVPSGAAVLAGAGASALIARIPSLLPPDTVQIYGPTYNEHAAAFRAAGWTVMDKAKAVVMVHPNNPDGRLWTADAIGSELTIIDESFCDVLPMQSLMELASRPNVVILKSFGKFWGLAGLRLGFAIGDPELVGRLAEMLGPWQVSGPAIEIGTTALLDPSWVETTRKRLSKDAKRLDGMITAKGAKLVGGTDLFRLYQIDSAPAWYEKLAKSYVLSRIFPYSDRWLRLGLPSPSRWDQLEAAL
jgi:cobalamin biosynthesis protein CobC